MYLFIDFIGRCAVLKEQELPAERSQFDHPLRKLTSEGATGDFVQVAATLGSAQGHGAEYHNTYIKLGTNVGVYKAPKV